MLRRPALFKIASIALAVALLDSVVTATSWIDCIDHNYDAVYTKSDDWVRGGANGNGACEGYAYNYPGRGIDEYDVTDYSWKVDASSADAPLCQYKQDSADYSGWRQAVHAKPGDSLYLGYMPNGHIVYKEDGAGSVWGVYWSGQAGVELTKASELTKDRLVDGTLRGFDDGNCGIEFTQDLAVSGRAGDTKPCVGSLAIPSGTKPGRYQMVWYWAPTNLEDGSASTAYSTCFDVIVDATEDAYVAAQVKPASLEAGALEARGAYLTPPSTLEVHDKRCDVDGEKDQSKSTTTEAPAVVDQQTTASTTTAPPVSQSPPVTTPAPDATTTPVVTASPAAIAAAMTIAESPPAPAALVSSLTAPLATVTYNGIGGSGLYGKVTAVQCPSSDTCTQSDFAVSGPVAPFDEDLTLALRGPLNIDEIKVYTSADATTWSHASSFSKQSASSQNMVFLNNKGDPLKSGVFDMCDGNSQSYATEDGTTASSVATQFTGVLGDDVEINVMSETSCAQSGTCGLTRGVAQEGWKGGNKIFMVKAKMPSAVGGKDLPAIWLLNGQIVRTAQYGCNCRGKGDDGKWMGGCGEFDVAEVLSGDHTAVTSTVYSFKGSRGTNAYGYRPVDDAVVFVAIITETTTTGSTDLGMAQVLMLKPEDIDMTTPPSSEQVQQWLSYRNGVQVDFDI